MLYTIKEGLTDNNITSIAQDEKGYLWAATQKGLNRFDGNRFSRYNANGGTLGLRHDKIFRLKKLGAQGIAIIGEGGLQVLQNGEPALKNYLLPDSGIMGAKRNKIFDAAILPGGDIALSTYGGFYVMDKTGTIKYRYDAYSDSDIGMKRMLFGRNILLPQGNELLLYHYEHNLSRYNINEHTLTPIAEDDKTWGAFAHPMTATGDGWLTYSQVSATDFFFLYWKKDSMAYYNLNWKKTILSPLPFSATKEFMWDGNVTPLNDSVFLINSRNSGFFIFQLDKKTGKITFNANRFLPSYTINAIFLDKDKRLWLGTTAGLLQQKQTNAPLQVYSILPGDEDKTGTYSSIYRHRGKLYLGRYSSNTGLVIADTAAMEAEQHINFFGNEPKWNEVYSIQMYHADTLWIGTTAGILWFDTKTHRYGKLEDPATGLPVELGNAVLATTRADGYAWMCSLLGGKAGRYHIATRRFEWFTQKTKPALPFNQVKSVVYDAYGDVWLSGHSLARWNNGQNRFDTLIKEYAGPLKYEENILSIRADDKGSLWLHNAYNGLLEYKITEKKFYSYTMAQGLPSNSFRSLSPIVNNVLWMADDNSLTAFNVLTKKSAIYTLEDGLPGLTVTGSFYYDSLQKKFYYPCNNDIVSFAENPGGSIDSSSGLLLQELDINSQKTIFEPKDGIRLDPGENNLFLRFTIINFTQADGYRFAYRLNEKDNWQSLGNQRNLALTNLSPGNYRLFLKATAKSGMEKSSSLRFSIAAPVWKRTWFIILVALLLAGAIAALLRSRINRVKQKANMEKQMAELEMKALHAQMNPHFIFNALNSIKEMIWQDEKQNASRYLSKFAQLIRTNLEQSTQTFISVRQCAEQLEQYLEMEKLRFEVFSYSIDMGNDLPDNIKIPPMLVQPLVENALWHGLRPKTGDKHLSISFYEKEKQLICEIEDNGIGYLQSQKNKTGLQSTHHSLGIENIKQRLAVLNEKYGMECSLSVTDKSELREYNGSGTIATLKLNL